MNEAAQDKRAVIYARAASTLALSEQMAACRLFILEQGWTPVGFWSDAAMPKDTLPDGLTQACNWVRDNGVPHFVVPHLDRLGRKPDQYRRSRDAIEATGAKIHYARLTVTLSEEMPGDVFAVRVRDEIIATLVPSDEGVMDWYPKGSDTAQAVTFGELQDRLYEFGGDVFYMDLAGNPKPVVPRPKADA
jgi:hypothetical protein